VARVVLVDQLDREDALDRHRGQPVLAMVVEAGRLRQLRAWELALRERVPEVDLFRVADVPTGRGVTRERVLDRLDGRVALQEAAIDLHAPSHDAAAIQNSRFTNDQAGIARQIELAMLEQPIHLYFGSTFER
jgi:hypothetical protein